MKKTQLTRAIEKVNDEIKFLEAVRERLIAERSAAEPTTANQKRTRTRKPPSPSLSLLDEKPVRDHVG